MPFGTEIALTPGLTAFERLYIKLLGVPILGLRIRARTILRLLDDVGTPQSYCGRWQWSRHDGTGLRTAFS